MRLTRIDVRSEDRRRVAVLTREGGNVKASLTLGAGAPKQHVVGARQEENLFELARIVQRELDGCRGTNSMVHDYYRLIQRLAD